MDTPMDFPVNAVECRRDTPAKLQLYGFVPEMFNIVMAMSVMSGGPCFAPDDADLPPEASGRWLTEDEARALGAAVRRYLDGSTLRALGPWRAPMADPKGLPDATRQKVADFVTFCEQGPFAMRRIRSEQAP